MPLCHSKTACKEVVVPDKNGNPIGGLSCASFCDTIKLPPGYEWWESASSPNANLRAPQRRDVVVLLDTDTGLLYELTRAECRTIMRAYREKWGRG